MAVNMHQLEEALDSFSDQLLVKPKLAKFLINTDGPYYIANSTVWERAPTLGRLTDHSEEPIVLRGDSNACTLLLKYIITGTIPQLAVPTANDAQDYHEMLIDAWDTGNAYDVKEFQNLIMQTVLSCIDQFPCHEATILEYMGGSKGAMRKLLLEELVLNICVRGAAE